MKSPGMTPAILPIKNLVFSATSTSIDTVIINGKTVMDDRKLLTLDEEKTGENAEKQAWRLLEGSGHLERYPEFLKRGKLTYV